MNVISCPWRFLKSHATTDYCCLSFVDNDGQMVHVFNQTHYSVSPTTGALLFQDIPLLENVVKADLFALNCLKCRLTTVKPFLQNKLIHLESYKAETKVEFWNIIYNLKSIWTNVNIEHESERIWPSKTTVMDVAIDADNSQSLYLLRPIKYTKNPNQFYYAISQIIFNLFLNSIENISGQIERSKRPRRVKCEKCCIPQNCTSTMYLLFGKNSFIHTLCCVDVKFLNHSWWEFVDQFIYFKWLTCLDEPGTLPDINEHSLSKSSMNKLNSLHRRWTAELEQMKQLESEMEKKQRHKRRYRENKDDEED
jgi:hypothetical protein